MVGGGSADNVRKKIQAYVGFLIGAGVAATLFVAAWGIGKNYQNKKQSTNQTEIVQYDKEISFGFKKELYSLVGIDSSIVEYLDKNYPQKQKEEFYLKTKKKEILKREGLEGEVGWWSE